MKGKSTDELKMELLQGNNIDSYIKRNDLFFTETGPTALLEEYYNRRKGSKADLARKAGMSEVYLHQVFSGRRKPSRDKLLCLCLALEVTADEAQKLLEQATYARLRPRIKRDAIILHGILHHTPLKQINEKLFLENEKTLC